MQVVLEHTNKKKPNYRLKILGTVIQRKGRLIADLTDEIEFKEENTYGSFKISFR
jgi:hypothetical protein